MDEQLYTNKINEFVDWVSGENVFTGEQVTNRLVGFFNSLAKAQINRICGLKGERGKTTKEDMINSELNKLYDFYIKNL